MFLTGRIKDEDVSENRDLSRLFFECAAAPRGALSVNTALIIVNGLT